MKKAQLLLKTGSRTPLGLVLWISLDILWILAWNLLALAWLCAKMGQEGDIGSLIDTLYTIAHNTIHNIIYISIIVHIISDCSILFPIELGWYLVGDRSISIPTVSIHRAIEFCSSARS